MRRAAVAWTTCAQETMNRVGLRCALNLAVPGRSVEQPEADVTFRIGQRLMAHNKFSLSFPIFVMLSDLFRIFSMFDMPVDNGLVSRKMLLRKIEELQIPQRISPYAINAI